MTKAKQTEREYSCVCTITLVASTKAATAKQAERKLDKVLFGVIKRGKQVEEGRLDLLCSTADGVTSTRTRTVRGQVLERTHDEKTSELAKSSLTKSGLS